MKTVFEYTTHFSYLKERLSDSARGTKNSFSLALQIQPAFLSQVLKEKYPLSLEQADLANKFFEHSGDESDFFLNLVGRDRAGSVSLKKYYTERLGFIHQKRQQLIERLGRKSMMTPEVQGVYYSSWAYSAVHIACTIPELATKKSLSDKLNISEEFVGKILDFLSENNFLQKSLDRYIPTNTWARLDKGSPHILRHHANWREKAIQNFDNQTDNDLHYSGVFSMDLKTARKIQNAFLDFVKVQLKEIEAAKEENLYVMGVDFFDLIKRN